MATAASTEAITAKDFLWWNPNSSDDYDIDSNPTKSHGAMATIRATCQAGAPQPGANAGDIIATPPACPASAAQKHVTIPATNTAAKAICARHATDRRQFMAAATTIAAVESRMCPSRTS